MKATDICYLDDDSFIDIHICQVYKLPALNVYRLMYVNYTPSIKLKKKKRWAKM